MADSVDIFAARMAEKEDARKAQDARIARGEISVADANAENEVFARALAEHARFDLDAVLAIEIDPSSVA